MRKLWRGVGGKLLVAPCKVLATPSVRRVFTSIDEDVEGLPGGRVRGCPCVGFKSGCRPSFMPPDLYIVITFPACQPHSVDWTGGCGSTTHCREPDAEDSGTFYGVGVGFLQAKITAAREYRPLDPIGRHWWVGSTTIDSACAGVTLGIQFEQVYAENTVAGPGGISFAPQWARRITITPSNDIAQTGAGLTNAWVAMGDADGVWCRQGCDSPNATGYELYDAAFVSDDSGILTGPLINGVRHSLIKTMTVELLDPDTLEVIGTHEIPFYFRCQGVDQANARWDAHYNACGVYPTPWEEGHVNATLTQSGGNWTITGFQSNPDYTSASYPSSGTFDAHDANGPGNGPTNQMCDGMWGSFTLTT